MWKTRHFNSEQTKVSKNEVVEKAVSLANYLMSANDVPKIIKIGGCVKATVSQTRDIF